MLHPRQHHQVPAHPRRDHRHGQGGGGGQGPRPRRPAAAEAAERPRHGRRWPRWVSPLQWTYLGREESHTRHPSFLGLPSQRWCPRSAASEPPDPPGPPSWSLAMSQGPGRGAPRPGTQPSSHCASWRSSGHIKSPPQASVSPLRGYGGAHLSRPLATPLGTWRGSIQSQGCPPPPEMMNWHKIPFVRPRGHL